MLTMELFFTLLFIPFFYLLYSLWQQKKHFEKIVVENVELTKELAFSQEKVNELSSRLQMNENMNKSLQDEKTHLSNRLVHSESTNSFLDTKVDQLIQDIKQLKQEYSELVSQKNDLLTQNSGYVAQYHAQKEKFAELQQAFEGQKKSFRDEMSTTLQELLEGKLKTFDETSTKTLETLLKPFKENMDALQNKVEITQKESGERLASLSKEIEMVVKAGLSISDQAQTLAKALKGEKQVQGRWGEMVLESVLEHSGLIKGDHYRIQENFKDELGANKRPDVVVKLPGDKAIIIDSKVSLNDYDRYIKAVSDEERALSAKEIARAFKNHIDTLCSKDYTHYSHGTLQYVFMFVPIEGAYALAVHHDASLYEYALQKHIVIVYPSTLVVTLKTIYLYWQREKSDIAVTQVMSEAGKLYDKLTGFIETFERMGRQLDTLSGSYHNAATQLYNGSGNVIKRAENLRILGAKATKSMSALKIKHSDIDNEDSEVIMPIPELILQEEIE